MARKAERKGERKLPSSKPADLAPHLIGTKGRVDRPQTGTPNEPLTFKVSVWPAKRVALARRP
jgi:hypothetical protein